MKRIVHALLGSAALLAGLTLPTLANAQCTPTWLNEFPSASPNNVVNDAITHDDGNGSALFVAGNFTVIGGKTIRGLARYDGHDWTQLSVGLNGNVFDLAVYNGQLFAAGQFTQASGQPTMANIVRWNGTNWAPFGTGTAAGANNVVNSMVNFNGSLYAAGSFTSIGGTAISRVARWDGTSWNPVGAGFDNTVTTLKVLNRNGTPTLWAAGSFLNSGATPVARVATFDGTNWVPVADGFNNTVNALAEFDGSIYAGGTFTNSGVIAANRIARFDGTSWNDVAAGVNNTVNALVPFNNGLIVGGAFTQAGIVANTSRFVRWTGTAWQALETPNSTITSLVPYSEGATNYLLVSGLFTSFDSVTVTRLVLWNTAGWKPFDRGLLTPPSGLASHDFGSGPELVAVGNMDFADRTPVQSVARFNPNTLQWNNVPGSDFNNNVLTAASLAGNLYVAGQFTQTTTAPALNRIAKFDGTTWSGLTSGFNNTVNKLLVHNGQLYAFGTFTTAGGASGFNRAAVWNGTTWSSLGGGLNNAVLDATVYNGDIVVCGTFTQADGQPALRIARWDGTAWFALAEGLNNTCYSVDVYNNNLYAGGDFTTAGLFSVFRFAKWDGTQWTQPTGGGPNSRITDFQVFDDGNGAKLFAVGLFTTVGAGSFPKFAAYDGTAWSAPSTLLAASGEAPAIMTVVPRGNTSDLYIAGTFDAIGSAIPSKNIARYENCASLCVADTDDGSGTGTIDGAVTIDDLLYFLTLFQSGNASADVDDGSGTGTHDGAVTIDDLLYFLVRFQAGC
ncbi:MAG: hypothetical protein IPK69_05505 [Phycisphaerales bacterium]|nr:MAG: hypothetical protein IPK69_05505 [Phycisphaerales bacterium]